MTAKLILTAVLAVTRLLTIALLVSYLYFSTELAVLFKNIKPKMTKWIILLLFFLQNIELENQKDFNPAVQKMSKNQVNPLLCC